MSEGQLRPPGRRIFITVPTKEGQGDEANGGFDRKEFGRFAIASIPCMAGDMLLMPAQYRNLGMLLVEILISLVTATIAAMPRWNSAEELEPAGSGELVAVDSWLIELLEEQLAAYGLTVDIGAVFQAHWGEVNYLLQIVLPRFRDDRSDKEDREACLAEIDELLTAIRREAMIEQEVFKTETAALLGRAPERRLN